MKYKCNLYKSDGSLFATSIFRTLDEGKFWIKASKELFASYGIDILSTTDVLSDEHEDSRSTPYSVVKILFIKKDDRREKVRRRVCSTKDASDIIRKLKKNGYLVKRTEVLYSISTEDIEKYFSN